MLESIFSQDIQGLIFISSALLFVLLQLHRSTKTPSCSRGRRPTDKLVTLSHLCTVLRSVFTLNTPVTCLSAECEVYEGPCLPEETIHYASLGRQNWRERPGRTPPDQNHHHIIYSSVITRPDAKQSLNKFNIIT